MRSVVAGMCLVSGTNQGLYARVSAHPDKLVLTSTDHFGRVQGPHEWDMDPASLLEEAGKGTHFSYMCGVAYQILIRCGRYRTTPQEGGWPTRVATVVSTCCRWSRVAVGPG